MNRKPFDKIDCEWGVHGEAVVRQYFIEQGYDVTVLPNGIYQQDLMFRTKHECFYVEVERCGAGRWCAGKQFPFTTINVLARREITSDRMFFTVSSDLKNAYVLFPDDIKMLDIIMKPNKHVKSEGVRQYPIERGLLLDFKKPIEHSIAAMNAERVRNIVNDNSNSYKFKMSVLRGDYSQFGPPYGIDLEDWRRLISFVEKTSGLSSLVSMPINKRNAINRQLTIEF